MCLHKKHADFIQQLLHIFGQSLYMLWEKLDMQALNLGSLFTKQWQLLEYCRFTNQTFRVCWCSRVSCWIVIANTASWPSSICKDAKSPKRPPKDRAKSLATCRWWICRAYQQFAHNFNVPWYWSAIPIKWVIICIYKYINIYIYIDMWIYNNL